MANRCCGWLRGYSASKATTTLSAGSASRIR